MESETKEFEPFDCVIVEPFLVDAIWPKASKILEKYPANDFDIYDLNVVKQKCEEDEWQLWLLMKDEGIVGCFCTNLIEEGNNKIANIFNLVGEDPAAWTKILDDKVSAFALQNGCNTTLAVMRKGFLRYAPDYKEVGTMYMKKLSAGASHE